MKSMFKTVGLCSVFAAAIYAQNPNPNPNLNSNPALSATPAGKAIQERRGTNSPVHSAGETLSPEAKEKLRLIQEKYRDEQKKIQERMAAARAQLNAAIQAENFDESAIRQKAAALAQVEADQYVLRAKQQHEVRALLPKQATQAVPAPAAKKTTKVPGSGANRPDIKSKSTVKE